MQVYDDKGLGCWLKANDPKSRQYTSPHKLTVTYSVIHTANAPCSNQGDRGACVGFTDLDILNTTKFLGSRRRKDRSGRYLSNDMGFRFYHEATVRDEWHDETWEPDDTGSSVLAGAKALKDLGFIDRYEWQWDMEGLLASLQRQPIMVGTAWTSGMNDPDRNNTIRPTGEIVGGHAYMLYGVNFRSRRVKMRNHWTADWGSKGSAWITFDDMAWLIQQDGEILVPVPV